MATFDGKYGVDCVLGRQCRAWSYAFSIANEIVAAWQNEMVLFLDPP